MNMREQLLMRRTDQKKTLQELSSVTGLTASVISNTLNGRRDSRISTFEALAGAMDASLVAVPNHLLPEVYRLISGKPIGPDDVLPAGQRLLRGEE